MTDFCWLIEAPGQNYLAVQEMPRMYFAAIWTKDHEKALRFYNAAQAQSVAMLIRQYDPAVFAFARTLGEAWPVEHGWLADGPKAHEPAPKPNGPTP